MPNFITKTTMNSPIENYKNTVKDVVSYESNHGKEFKTEVRVRKYMCGQAKTTVRKKQLITTNSEN